MKLTCLIVGGSRGLGFELVKASVERGYTTYTTIRSPQSDKNAFPEGVNVFEGIDLLHENASSEKLERAIKGKDLKFDLVIYSAGIFKRDTIDSLKWKDIQDTITICAIAPAFIASTLRRTNNFASQAKFIVVTSEAGSIALRTAQEGGENYGHHVSKAAANMTTKLLSIDLAKHDVTTLAIHPGFMKTEMTANVGFDQFWEEGGAVEPKEAANSLLDFLEENPQEFSEKNGQFWAPRGPADVGTAESVMDKKDMTTPLKLPW